MAPPSKPKGVVFGDVEETEISISWEKVEGATGYKVLVKDFSIEGDWNVPEVMVHEFDGTSCARKLVAAVPLSHSFFLSCAGQATPRLLQLMNYIPQAHFSSS